MTQAEVRVVDALREQRREAPAWLDDLEATVRRAFDHPSEPAHEGWEALDRTRERVTTAVRALIAEHPREDLVLVGHGTAWTVLAADLAGEEPDLERWRSLGMPDVVRVELDTLRHA